MPLPAVQTAKPIAVMVTVPMARMVSTRLALTIAQLIVQQAAVIAPAMRLKPMVQRLARWIVATQHGMVSALLVKTWSMAMIVLPPVVMKSVV